MEADDPKRSRGRWLAVVLAAVLVVVVGGYFAIRPAAAPDLHRGTTSPAGTELELAKAKPYGWSAAMAVGARFTDGLNFMTVTSAARGPLTIISVTPLMDGGPALKVIGVLARIAPDMLPANSQTGWFESADDFPPSGHDNGGGVDPRGLVVRAPTGDDTVDVEVMIGFEVVAAGKSNKHGVRVRYSYQGGIHEWVIPSHLTLCAPAKVTCPAEEA